MGQAVTQLVEALRQNTGGPGFDSRWGPWEFSSNPIFLPTFSSLGVHSASNRNEYQEISLGEKRGQRVELCCPICAEYHSKDGSPTFQTL